MCALHVPLRRRRNLIRNVDFIQVYLLLLGKEGKKSMLFKMDVTVYTLSRSPRRDLREQTLAGCFNHEHL